MPLFKDIKALTVYQLNNILCLVYKSIRKICPRAFLFLASTKPPHKYNLRHAGSLYEPKCKTKFGQFGIRYRAPHLWSKRVLNENNYLLKLETRFRYIKRN